jgi:hypothetical protein
MTRTSAACLLLVAVFSLGENAADPPDAIALSVARGLGPGEVTLTWTGGNPEFGVYRSANASAVVSLPNSLGHTASRNWTDAPPAGSIFFYNVVGLANVTVTALSPADGLATTSTAVTIDGTNFAAGATATFGANAPSACTLVSSTRVTCTAPANGGVAARVNVTVTNPASVGGAFTLTNGFTYTRVRNETDLPAEADFCNLQFPSTLEIPQATPSPSIFGRIFEAGVTEAPGASPSVLAQVGYGPSAGDPTIQSGWLFVPATFNVQVGNDDEYVGTLTVPAAGDYRYTYRFSFDGGLTYTYCDLNGAGSNAGLFFEASQLGTMTVTP